MVLINCVLKRVSITAEDGFHRADYTYKRVGPGLLLPVSACLHPFPLR